METVLRSSSGSLNIGNVMDVLVRETRHCHASCLRTFYYCLENNFRDVDLLKSILECIVYCEETEKSLRLGFEHQEELCELAALSADSVFELLKRHSGNEVIDLALEALKNFSESCRKDEG